MFILLNFPLQSSQAELKPNPSQAKAVIVMSDLAVISDLREQLKEEQAKTAELNATVGKPWNMEQ